MFGIVGLFNLNFKRGSERFGTSFVVMAPSYSNCLRILVKGLPKWFESCFASITVTGSLADLQELSSSYFCSILFDSSCFIFKHFTHLDFIKLELHYGSFNISVRDFMPKNYRNSYFVNQTTMFINFKQDDFLFLELKKDDSQPY